MTKKARMTNDPLRFLPASSFVIRHSSFLQFSCHRNFLPHARLEVLEFHPDSTVCVNPNIERVQRTRRRARRNDRAVVRKGAVVTRAEEMFLLAEPLDRTAEMRTRSLK